MPEKEQPIEPEYREKMNQLGRFLDEFFNGPAATKETRQTAFALFVFKFGEGDDHRSNYISNAERESMIATLKEFIARAEGRHHEFNPMKV